jgi:hypothetical protein
MSVTYGIKIASTNDRYIAIAEKALEGMGQAASPGAFFVDLLPCREHISQIYLSIVTYPLAPLRIKSNMSREFLLSALHLPGPEYAFESLNEVSGFLELLSSAKPVNGVMPL